jgi:hypothetical protein
MPMPYRDGFTTNATVFAQLREYNAAHSVTKDAAEQTAFLAECRRAVLGLLSASTYATGLVVDVDAVALSLFTAIVSSPRR